MLGLSVAGIASPCWRVPHRPRSRATTLAQAIAWSWWAGPQPGDRRLLLAARWRRDPGGRAAGDDQLADRTEVGSDEAVTTGRHRPHRVIGIPSTAPDLSRNWSWRGARPTMGSLPLGVRQRQPVAESGRSTRRDAQAWPAPRQRPPSGRAGA